MRAASVGVEARTSATRSRIGASFSWPIAETTGRAAGGDGAHEALVGERQQVLDRAAAARHHDDVDLGERIELAHRRDHLARRPSRPAPRPRASRTPRRASGGARSRRRRARRRSPRPHTRPTRRGRKGRRRLRAGSNRPSAASRFLRASSWASSSPRPTGRISSARNAERSRGARPELRPWRGRPRAGPRRAAARSGRGRAVEHDDRHRHRGLGVAQGQVDGAGDPGRRLSCATWPSTHTAPRRATYPSTASAIVRTGAGCSGEVSRATRGA